MFFRVAFLFVCAVALATASPAKTVKTYRDLSKVTPRHPMVSPNWKYMPFNHVLPPLHSNTPPAVRGTKAVEGCGISSVKNRIVGGEEATPHSYPWQVGLFIDGFSFCGGSLISDEWVLTAAHCADGAGQIEVVMGAHNINQNEDTQVSITSSEFIVHSRWSFWTLANDIALIHLPRKVEFNKNINAVCLPKYSEENFPTDSESVKVNPSGWGRPSDSTGSISPVLRQVVVPTMSNADCRNVYGSTITDTIVCIDSVGGKGTCNGDSGGPLNLKTNGVTTTYGVVSFGSSTGCETGYPDGFTRVAKYLSWIEENTGIVIDK